MIKSVLVVEDDSLARAMIVEFLNDAGFLVYDTADGQEAISIIAQYQPSLVLLDLRLARLSGLEVLSKSKEVSPETLIVILSGNQDEAMAKKAISLGAYDYLTKPISLTALQSQILDRIFE